MTIDMSQFYEVFFDEAEELLAEAERLLLGIDVSDPDAEDLNAIFRSAHSIKGGAATFGFMDMTEITHVLENLLDKIRTGAMALTSDHVDAFLAAKDVLEMELEGHRSEAAVDQEQVDKVKEMLRVFTDAEGIEITPVENVTEAAAHEEEAAEVVAETAPEPEVTEASVSGEAVGFTILMPEITEKDFSNLKDELALLGGVETKQLENKRYEFTLSTMDSTEADIISICSFVIDADDMVITPLMAGGAETDASEPVVETEKASDAKSGLFEKTEADAVATEAPVEATSEEVKPAEAKPAEPEKAAAAPIKEKRKGGRRESDKQAAGAETTSIRVGIEKVDQLINLVGELVITQAMIEQRISALDPAQNEPLINSVGQLTRNTRDLQESVMSIRMMPMDFVFSRFPRMVRDLAGKLDKKVDFITQGATTELDKGLIERIVDPLTHLVRNSVDHGIELPSKRKAEGKPEAGQLTLSAAHRGGSIVIEVTDDGGGLDRDKLLEKASSNGLEVSEAMTDTEVYQLIFAPGFSTAATVTDVSGRGVGMDVVKRNITAMGGTVEIRSMLGKGTTISIALPLTLAILDGMSVSLGESTYVIPLNLIVETMQPRMEEIKTVTGEGLMVNVRGEYLPIIPLYALFNQDTEIMHPTEGVLVILESEGKKAALFLDGLVGQQQVVIKSLETNYKKITGVSGATIMGDGSVALILDVPAIIKMGQHNSLGAYQ